MTRQARDLFAALQVPELENMIRAGDECPAGIRTESHAGKWARVSADHRDIAEGRRRGRSLRRRFEPPTHVACTIPDGKRQQGGAEEDGGADFETMTG